MNTPLSILHFQNEPEEASLLEEKLDSLPTDVKTKVEDALTGSSEETESVGLRKISNTPISERCIIPEGLQTVCAEKDVFWAEKIDEQEGKA